MNAGSTTKAAISFAVAMALPSACAAPAASSVATLAPSATAVSTPNSSGPQAIRVGSASAGSWTTTAFEPTLRFTIPSDGWFFFFPDEDDELAVGKGDVELTASRVASVVDPGSHKAVPAPEDLVAWFRAHPDLDAGTPDAASIGGLRGRSVVVTNSETSHVDIFAFDAGNLRVARGTTALITVVPYEGPDLVFCAFAPEASFGTSLQELTAILESIEIGGS